VDLSEGFQIETPTVFVPCYELGSFFEADVELSRAGRLAGGDEHRVAVAGARVGNLVCRPLRPEDALAVNQAARAASETA
jgi:hypothetical protein